MALEGSIKDFGLSDIFQLIYVQQKSGVMSVRHQARKATVGFEKGMVVSAQSDDSEGVERIGDVLVRAKRITPQQLETALKLQRDRGEYLGQVLVSEGFLSPDDLKRALKLQTLEAVYRLFRWRDGRYAFDQKPVPYPKEYIEPISTEHILMEGVRRLDEWPYIERKIPSLDMIFAQVPGKQGEIDQAAEPKSKEPAAASDDPLADFETETGGRFAPEEIAVYHAVDGTHPISRIIELVQLGEFEVCKGLANLLTAGLVVSVGVAKVAPAVSDAPAEPSRILAWLSTTFQWTVNLALIAGLAVAAAWYGKQAWDHAVVQVEADVQSARIIMLPHHIKGIRELVQVWKADHGSVPGSVFDPITAYGASTWPLSDPWGKPWTYDSIADIVSGGSTSVSEP